MKQLIYTVFLLLFFTSHVQAENVMMVRTYDTFDVTLESVKQSLTDYGYKVAHVQKCDGGLGQFGFTTDAYRVVFFGKPDEVRYWSKKEPALIPYLPLKIAVFAEGDQVLVVSFNPEELGALFADREIKIQFSRWKNDIKSVLRDVSGQP